MEFGDILSTKFVSEVQEDAAKYIIEMEKKSVRPLIDEIVIRYAADNQILMSNIKKIMIWLQNPSNLDLLQQPIIFKPYQLYCIDPKYHATALLRLIRDSVDVPTQLVIKLMHNDYRINCDFFEVIQINRLLGKQGSDDNFGIPKYIDPIIIPHLSKSIMASNPESNAESQQQIPQQQIPQQHPLLFLPPEIEIIEVHHKLYLPNFSSEWRALLPIEAELYKSVLSRVEKIGGRIHKKHKFAPSSSKCRNCDVNIATLRSLIFKKFIKKDYVVVGSWALADISSEPATSKLQLISKNAIDDDIAALDQFLKLYTSFGITYRDHDMHIPQDFRIHRTTVMIQCPSNGGVKEKPLLDIFNSGQFELVPYVTSHGGHQSDDHLIGNYWVLLRFSIIDLSIVRLIWRLGFIDDKIKTKYLDEIMNTIIGIKNSDILANTVFGVDYYGIHIDQDIARKVQYLAQRNTAKRGADDDIDSASDWTEDLYPYM